MTVEFDIWLLNPSSSNLLAIKEKSLRSILKQVLLNLLMRRWKLLDDSMNASLMLSPGFLGLAIVPFILLGHVASKTRYDARLRQT
jgi:hypothetical protein